MSAPTLAHCEAVQCVTVCYGAQGIHRRTVFACPTCERRTPFVQTWDGAYYGVTDYCTICLDYWQEGGRGPRPFERYWKRDRAALIRRLWDTALLPDAWRAWTRLDVHRATCHTEGQCPECEATP